MRGASGDLHIYTVTQEVTAIHFIAGVIGVSVVIKLHKAEAILQGNLANSTEFSEKTLHILFTGTVVQSADIHSG